MRVLEAAAETDRDENSFPETCPYAWDEIMERPIAWPPKD